MEGEVVDLQLARQKRLSDKDEDSEDEERNNELEESFEGKKLRLTKDLKLKLVQKENLVPKTGKGRFNLTVPMPFEFLSREKVGFSTRQKNVEKMIMDKEKELQRELSFKYRAREVPAHVKTNKYEKICEQQEKKRRDTKRLAMAKIKATQKPFTF